jgi:hypothetical protein
MEKLAKMAAKEAVSEAFLSLGMDISNPISFKVNSPSCETFTTAHATLATWSLPAFSARPLAAPLGRSWPALRLPCCAFDRFC